MDISCGYDRRRLMTGGAAVAIAPALAGWMTSSSAHTAIVEIEHGKLLGQHAGGALSFKGIPYAANTAGPNRFMAPRPVEAWAGVRDARQFGDRSIQAGRFGQPLTLTPSARSEPRQSENCCVLNVYTPNIDNNARQPVMFWMHGGGFRSGAGDAPTLDGTNLAQFGNVVVVTVNHRLNLFGYLPLGHLDPAFADAGNAGQLDLIAALEWVKRNIRAFGGDPDNVTIFGQSGGGSKASTLMIMPSARGLFHRLINMSGPTFYTMDAADKWEPLTDHFIKELGLTKNSIRKLQQLPPRQLLAAHGAAVRALKTDDFRPVIDGPNIPHGPMTPSALVMNPVVPIMIGTTETEASLWLRRDPRNTTVTVPQVRGRIMRQFNVDEAKAGALIAAYQQDEQNQTPWDILQALACDTMFRGRMLLAAEALAKARPTPVYVYNFGWKLPADGGIWGSPHAVDIPFAFGNVELMRSTVGPGEGPVNASLNMMSAFIEFARTGDPNNSRMPRWKAYDDKTRPTMTINETCRLVDDFRGAGRQASLELLYQDAYELETGSLFEYAV